MRTIFNFLGPLTNPAGAPRQVIGVSDPAFLETIAGALARLGAGKALVVSSADGLDEMSTAGTTEVVEVDGAEIALLRASRRRTSGSPSSTYEDVAGGTPRAERRRSRARIFAGEHGPRARPRGRSTPAPRSTSPGRGGHARERRAGGRGRRSTRARAAEALDALVALTQQAGPGLNVLERIVERRARSSSGRREAVPLAAAGGARSTSGPRTGPFWRGARAPRHLADRRAQAPLAVGRRHPRGRDGDARSSAPTSAAAPPRSRSSPRRSTSAARSTTCARRAPPRELPVLRKDFIVDPLPALRVGGGRRRRDPADRRRARPRRPATSCTARRARSTSTCSSRSTTSASWSARSTSTPTSSASTTATSTDFSVDVERTYELLSDVPAGKTVVSESGFSTREQLDDLERVGVDAVLVGETLMRAATSRRPAASCRRARAPLRA